MDNLLLQNEISYWQSILPKTNNPKLLELAFFKIFIKFEKFASDLFIHYSIGNSSIEGYCPNRTLCFLDDTHLNSVIRNKNKGFVNYYENITELSQHIFIDNPFEIITTDSVFSSEFNNMKILRNYIAHESQFAENKYIISLLNNRSFIEPYLFLEKNRKNTGKSNFTTYVEIMNNTSEYLLKGPVT